ncbi:MAG: hypothetical protein WBA33_07810 [Rhodanobacter lindaniclasticus]
MELLFRQLPDNEMERPPTQRDQFDNDDVELVDALVRESIQNSLDANDRSQSRSVRVCFNIKKFDGKELEDVLSLIKAEDLNPHLAATGLAPLDESAEQFVLTVEDFGTTGLTGCWDAWDQKPFCDFWRRMGRSHKGGQSLGRWGLGKLVFSSSSRARVFLGLTVRHDDGEALLMGQAVLTHHTLPDGTRLDSHAFYAVEGAKGFQLPESSLQMIENFRSLFGLQRTTEPGLSIVVPALRENITLERISQGVLRNYFFPILFGRLEVQVGDVLITEASFTKLAEKLDAENFSGGHLASFIQEMKATRDPGFEPSLILPPDWHKKDMEGVLAGQIEGLRHRFAEGDVVMVRAPVLMKRKDGTELPSFIDAFLKRAPTNHPSMFVRHAIVLNAEHKYFKGSKVFGALIADDTAVSEFLGDAENPAHTGWSASAEKVAAKWRSTRERLSDIRQLLKRLYNTLVSAVETVDKDALVSVFSLPAENGSKQAASKGKEAKPPKVPLIEPKPRSYRLSHLPDGFKLQDGAISEEDLPITIRVRAAYDVLRGNPFKKHSAADFDFTKKGAAIESLGAAVSAASANILLVEVKNPRFVVNVTGFDTNRDLILDAEKVS